ncbi:hypothetical protein [Actinoplanes rectilineatus]|uniref:hypothetical protein n=1 Tax=Actinoplanes rectilineatus TaxID=113571 RepID=UPI0005F2DC70|nr:hypothetical protein [Actinoplanes rectilineatus]
MTSPPAYAVPGIEPAAGTVGQGGVSYRDDHLAGLPAVAAVLDRLPDTLIAPAGPDEARTEFPITRADLAAQVHVGTGDGLRWGLGFDDEVGALVHRAYARHLGRDLPY